MRIISWNIAHRDEAWRHLADDPALDVALLQEATRLPSGVTGLNVVSGQLWSITGWESRRFSAEVAVRDSRDVEVKGLTVKPIGEADHDQVAVSRAGSLAAAEVLRAPGISAPITVVSVYAPWERPVPYNESGWIYADASAHRLLSDISALINTQHGHRIIVSGDWNILRGYGENSSPYWARRYQTVFDRMNALGFEFRGPQSPDGMHADPWPEELPLESTNVPTFRPAAAAAPTRQLDFVFASRSISAAVTAKALNACGEEWGPSDHCRIEITVNE